MSEFSFQVIEQLRRDGKLNDTSLAVLEGDIVASV